jgi:sensor domain CHASE-containing protein
MPRLSTALGRIDRFLWRWPSLLVICLLWSGGITIALLMLWAAESQDRLAAEKSVALLYNVLEERRHQLAQLARDYSWWDDAAVNLVLSPNAEWAAANIGPYLTNSFTVAASLVLDPTDKQVLGFLRGVPPERDLVAQFAGGIDRLAHDARQQPAEAPAAVTGFVRFGNEIHIASASLIVPTRADLRKAYSPQQWAHVLLLTQSLDDDALRSIGARYGLAELSFREGQTSADTSSIQLVAPNGDELGSLVWKAERPGIAMLRHLLIPVALAFDIMVILAILILRHINRTNRNNQRNLELVVAKNTELEQMAALQRIAFDAMSDAIALLDSDLCLVSWNRPFAEIHDHPPGLLQSGIPLIKVLRAGRDEEMELSQELRTEIAIRLAAVIRRDVSTIEITLANGRTVELRHIPLPNGRLMLTYRPVAEDRESRTEARRASAVTVGKTVTFRSPGRS